MGIDSRDPTMQALYDDPEDTKNPQSKPPPSQMFSTKQVAVGTFFFGPLAGSYYLKKNFAAFGRPAFGRQFFSLGVLYTMAYLVVMLSFLENDGVAILLTIVTTVLAGTIAAKSGMGTAAVAAAPSRQLHSWGHVIGAGILSVIGIFVLGFVTISLLSMFGITFDFEGLSE